ncbi:MAG: cupin domain-containing protein, partial [Alphaproteobacteria bacterium]
GFISQVERELTVPSLSSLASISGVLQTHIAEFLSQPPASTFTRKDERALFALDQHALQYERLSTNFPGNVLNSVIVHEPPGYRSEPIQHEGEELFYILKGSITVELEEEPRVLHAGDSLHFKSSRRHSSWNHTTEPVTILHVCTMDVLGDNPASSDEPGNRAGHETSETTSVSTI